MKEFKDNVYFRIGKYEISGAEAKKINAVADMLKDNPSAKVSLTGYADAQTGTPERNWYLSRKRAEAVAAELEKAGIPSERIDVSYKGPTEAPYSSPEKNRVVVCVVGGIPK